MANSTSPVQWLAIDTLKKTAHYKYDIYIYLIEVKKITHYMGYQQQSPLLLNEFVHSFDLISYKSIL